MPDADMADVVVAEPASGAPLTVLGLALGDETVSTQTAAAWAVYPIDLHQALADNMYARLYDNMEGAEEQWITSAARSQTHAVLAHLHLKPVPARAPAPTRRV